MSDTGWIVIGIIALVSMFVFVRELRRLLDRATNVEIGPGGVKIKAAKTPLGKMIIANQPAPDAAPAAPRSPAPTAPAAPVQGMPVPAAPASLVPPAPSFHLEWPQNGNWIRDDVSAAGIGAALLVRFHKSFEKFNPNVNVTVENIGDMDVHQWMDYGNQAFAKLGWQVDNTWFDDATQSGVRVVRNAGVAGTLYQIQRAILRGGKAYVATASKLDSDAGAFPGLYEEMRNILNSFRVA